MGNEPMEKSFPAEIEPVINGAPSGTGGQVLLDANGDFRALRPWKETKYDPARGEMIETGRNFIDVTNAEGKPDVQPVANATLRYDEWKLYDQAIQTANRDRLIGVADLESRNLTRDIGDGMGTFQLMYEERTANQEAQMDMTGEARGNAGDVQYTQKFLPIPIIYSHFRVNMRRLMASRKTGESIDTVLAEESTVSVNEKQEDLLFSSTTFTYGGSTIQTYLTHPNRITGSSAANDWSSTSVDNIISDVRAMKQAQLNVKHRGPWILYIPSSLETRMDEDYNVSGTDNSTLRDRLMKIGGLEDIKVADRMADGNALLVEMRRSNVRLVRGMDINPVQWTSPSGMAAYFQVMTIRVPQIRTDANGNLGITHHTW